MRSATIRVAVFRADVFIRIAPAIHDLIKIRNTGMVRMTMISGMRPLTSNALGTHVTPVQMTAATASIAGRIIYAAKDNARHRVQSIRIVLDRRRNRLIAKHVMPPAQRVSINIGTCAQVCPTQPTHPTVFMLARDHNRTRPR